MLQKVVKCYFVPLPRLSYIYSLTHFKLRGLIFHPIGPLIQLKYPEGQLLSLMEGPSGALSRGHFSFGKFLEGYSVGGKL